jgi:hypothetical protein
MNVMCLTVPVQVVSVRCEWKHYFEEEIRILLVLSDLERED